MTRQQTPDILGAMLDGAAAKPAVTLDYDYALMTEDSATAAIAAAQQIKPRMQSAVEDIIAIGAELRTVKSKIDHGHWLPWVESELQMEPRTAQRFMAVARAYAGKNDTVSYLNLSTVYKLIQAPQSARDEIEAMPEPPTNADARRIIAEHKPAPLTGEVLPPEPDAAGQHTPRGTCRICKRPLTSSGSVANGMGDVCAAHAARDADIEDAKANAHAQPQTQHGGTGDEAWETVTVTMQMSRERWGWLCDEVFNRGSFADWIDEDFAAIEQAFGMAKITEKITP